jgi:serine protease Do
VTIQDVDQSLAQLFGLHEPQGALVSSVEKNAPAAKAGLQPGDVILRVGDKQIDRSGDLSGLVADLTPGTTVTLRIWRAGSARDVSVTVGALPVARTASASVNAERHRPLGLTVRPLTPEEQKATELEGGLLVDDVSSRLQRLGSSPAT